MGRLHHPVFAGLTVAVVSMNLAGCSVYMAAKQPPKKNLEVLREGTPRSLVLAELGEPISSETKDGKRLDLFTFRQGYSKGAKTSRAVFHGAADVFTAGLWEVVATPAEAIFDGKQMAFEVTYDESDRVEMAVPPAASVQISRLVISYSYPDTEFVDALETALTAKGIRCSRDLHDDPDSTLDTTVDRNTFAHSTVVLVVSENSAEKKWVKDELRQLGELAEELGRRTLYPVALDDSWKSPRVSRKLGMESTSFQKWRDATGFDHALQQLLDRLSLFYARRQ